MLMETLHSLVSQGYAPPRLVCEILLKYLDIRNMVVWTESLELVRNLVGGVHYKGCRDLMKQLFNVFDRLPRNIPEQQTTALLKGQEVIQIIILEFTVMYSLYNPPFSCYSIFLIEIALSYLLISLTMRYDYVLKKFLYIMAAISFLSKDM